MESAYLCFLGTQWISPLLTTLLTLFHLILTENWVKMWKQRFKVLIYSLPNHTVNKTGVGVTTRIKYKQLSSQHPDKMHNIGSNTILLLWDLFFLSYKVRVEYDMISFSAVL